MVPRGRGWGRREGVRGWGGLESSSAPCACQLPQHTRRRRKATDGGLGGGAAMAWWRGGERKTRERWRRLGFYRLPERLRVEGIGSGSQGERGDPAQAPKTAAVVGGKGKKEEKKGGLLQADSGKGGGGRESERGCSVSRFWKHSRRVAGRARMTPGAMRHGTETRRPCGADGDRVTVAAAERSATPRARKTIGATGNSERRRRETAWETERERANARWREEEDGTLSLRRVRCTCGREIRPGDKMGREEMARRSCARARVCDVRMCLRT